MPPADTAVETAAEKARREVIALLHSVAGQLTSSASAQYRERFGIGVMDVRIISVLSQEPDASGARIAEATGLDKAAVSRSLGSLARRGLTRSTSSGGRARFIALTDAGRALHDAVWKIGHERHRRLLQGFSPVQLDLLRTMLRQLYDALPLVDQNEANSHR